MIKNIMSMLFITLTAICVLSSASYAGLDNTIGARGEGIGFSFSTLADEPFGTLYNPAGAAFVKGLQTQFQYYKPTSYGLITDNESPYGGIAGINYFQEKYGNIIFNIHQYGSFTDQTSVTTSSTVNLSYARLISDYFAAGASVKYLFESNMYERSAFDLDFGIMWRSQYNVSAAASGENLLKSELSSNLTNLAEYLPRKFRLTGAYHIPMANNAGSILAGWQLEQAGIASTNNTSLFNFGSEWWIGTNNSVSFGLRAGYTFGKTTVVNTETDFNRWSTGFSLNFDLHGQDLRIDYAFRSFPFESNETLPSDNFISITYGWGGVPDYYRQRNDKKYDLAKYQQHLPSPIQTRPDPVMEQDEPLEEIADIAETPLPVPEQVVISPPLTLNPDQEPVKRDEEPAHQPIEQIALVDEIVQTPAPALVPATPEPEYPLRFAKLNIELDFVLMDIGHDSKMVFYLRPQGLMRLNSWKLYVFSAKLKKWTENGANSYAVHKIEGKGITPLTVIWNGILEDGSYLKPGKYYYVVIAWDKYGQAYKSDWCKFKVK